MSRLPSGSVTFLLTDIEGSTKRWQETPEPMKAALARHHALLQQAIEPMKATSSRSLGTVRLVAAAEARCRTRGLGRSDADREACNRAIAAARATRRGQRQRGLVSLVTM
jgi:class 3 adenylate cyclase